MAKKRTGSIQMHGGQLQARHWVTIDGVSVRRWFPLGTTSKGLARRKNEELMKRLARGEVPDVKATAAIELCSEAFTRVYEQKREEGLPSWKTPMRILHKYAGPVMGHLRVDQVGAPHIRDAMVACKNAGRAKGTVEALRTALSGVFKSLLRDRLIKENPVALQPLLKMKKDPRARETLQDDEFVQFALYEPAPLRLRTMAVASRGYGGLRTSDLHAWQWPDFDLAEWNWAWIVRSKTGTRTKHAMPDEIRIWMHRWWLQAGKPTKGFVFGLLTRPGERCRKASYAIELRHWLKEAGLTRPELFANTAETKQVDFHSFRRAYCEALAISGIPAQMAMKLAAHTKLETHMMYLKGMALPTPEGVMPSLQRPAPQLGPKEDSGVFEKPEIVCDIADLDAAANDDSVRCRIEQDRETIAFSGSNVVPPNQRFAHLRIGMGPKVWTIPAGTPVTLGKASSEPSLPR